MELNKLKKIIRNDKLEAILKDSYCSGRWVARNSCSDGLGNYSTTYIFEMTPGKTAIAIYLDFSGRLHVGDGHPLPNEKAFYDEKHGIKPRSWDYFMKVGYYNVIEAQEDRLEWPGMIRDDTILCEKMLKRIDSGRSPYNKLDRIITRAKIRFNRKSFYYQCASPSFSRQFGAQLRKIELLDKTLRRSEEKSELIRSVELKLKDDILEYLRVRVTGDNHYNYYCGQHSKR